MARSKSKQKIKHLANKQRTKRRKKAKAAAKREAKALAEPSWRREYGHQKIGGGIGAGKLPMMPPPSTWNYFRNYSRNYSWNYSRNYVQTYAPEPPSAL